MSATTPELPRNNWGRQLLDQAFSRLPAGTTLWTLLFAALAAALGQFGSDKVVEQQASFIIAAVVGAGTLAIGFLWQRRNPTRLAKADAPDPGVLRELSPYLARRDAGGRIVSRELPGRTADIENVAALVTDNDLRLAIVHGVAGSGKTSLLQAGVAPLLEKAGWRVWYAQRLDPCPMHALCAAAEGAGQGLRGAQRNKAAFLAMLDVELADSERTGVLVVCDAVDRLMLTGVNPAERDEFAATIADIVARPRARVLLVARNEALAAVLDRTRQVLPDAGAIQTYDVHRFAVPQAEQALESLLSVSGQSVEAKLPARITRDLARGNVVSPAEVQVVAHQLARNGITTLVGYILAGGACGLERAYFERRVDDLRALQLDPATARRVLAQLSQAEHNWADSERPGVPVEGLGNPDQTLMDELENESLVERTRIGYRLAYPGLAQVCIGLSDRTRRGVGPQTRAHAVLCWFSHVPRILLGIVGLATLTAIGLVVYLLALGFPQGRQIATLQTGGKTGAVALIAFDSTGRYLAVDDGPAEIQVWEIGDQNRIITRLSKKDVDASIPTNFLAFRDSTEVRLFGPRGELWAWDIKTGDLIINRPEPLVTYPTSPLCVANAPAVDRTARLLVQGTTCGSVYVMDVDQRRASETVWQAEGPNCLSESIVFSRAENQLLDFYRCKGNDKLQLRYLALQPGQHSPNQELAVRGTPIKALYGEDGNPWVLTVTPDDTHLWELKRKLARARWPLAMYDGAPTDLDRTGRLLAVVFADSGVRLYERAWWPFEWVPVKEQSNAT